MGVVFIVTVLWAPDGVMGLLRRLRAGAATGTGSGVESDVALAGD